MTISNNLNQSSKEKTVIFVHIPKTGGTTFDKLIKRQYESKSLFLFTKVEESLARFRQLNEDEKREIKFIQGHMRYGLHKEFPQPCTYMTILREPIERVISLYYYVLRTPENPAHDQVKSKNMSLKEYVSSGIASLVNNNQTRFLCTTESVGSYGQCSPEMLESAQKNLRDNFAAVGLTERYNETLILLKRTFNWKNPYYVKVNVTKNRPLKEDVDKDTIKLIEKYNELDIELYKYGEERFEELLNQSGYSYNLDLKQFNLLNGIYSKYPFYRRIVNKVKVF